MRVFEEQTLGPGKLLGVFEQGSQEWHQARTQGIGGSEIGACLGLSPWVSAYRLWAIKTGQVTEAPVDNWAVRLGKAFEQPILDLWQEQYPEWEVFTCGTYQHSQYPWALANPDAIARHRETGELMVLEVKTARNYWTDGVPLHYLAQVQWYLAITGIKKGRIIAVAGWDWQDIEIPADEFEHEVMFTSAQRFWLRVTDRSEPEWDGSRVTYETVRELHPDIEDTEEELGELGVNLVTAQLRFDEAEATLNSFKSATLSAMGRAKYGIVTLDGMEPRTVAVRKARGSGNPWLEVRRS